MQYVEAAEVESFADKCTFYENYARAYFYKCGHHVCLMYQGESKTHSSGEVVFVIPKEYTPDKTQYWCVVSVNNVLARCCLEQQDDGSANLILSISESVSGRVYMEMNYFID